MTRKPNIIVTKVPLEKPPVSYPQVFPKMPVLYLELLENKAKVKQDLINKPYIPPTDTKTSLDTHFKPSTPSKDKYKEKDKEKDKEKYKEKDKKSNNDSDTSSSISSISWSKDKEKDKGKNKEAFKAFDSRLDKLLNSKDDDSSSSDSISSLSSISDLSISEKKKSASDSKDSDSDRLKQLLRDDSDSDVSFGRVSKSTSKSRDKYSQHRDRHGRSINHQTGTAPTLAELEAHGGYVPRKELRNMNQPTYSDQQEEDSKRELLFKFDMIRKKYPTAIVPEYTIHSDIIVMQKSYDDVIKRVVLDSTVEDYKKYLVYGFIACEFILGKFAKFDMDGFTRQQMLSMNSYEKLLIELGEKSYVPTGSKWPVEIRLIGLIIMNAAMFIVGKMIMNKTGENIMGMFNNMTSNTSSGKPPTRKTKMRGPSIDPEDIPDITPPPDNSTGTSS